MNAVPLADSPVSGGRPSDTAARICERLGNTTEPVWISRVPDDQLLAAARRLDDADPALPLYGIPFAVKDNIDVAGMPTTAGCPGAARIPETTAPVVTRLLDAGALLVGKTNMDQFATGLVGTRSPYGACSSVYDASRVSGGSSSGSALAVALGLVAFALGTDTAGSGRVPAAFNGLIGLKPTRGLVSCRGTVPACPSLDCISIFDDRIADAASVLGVAAGFDARDPWSRRAVAPLSPRTGRIGVPLPDQAEPDEPEAAAAWAAARGRAGEQWMLQPVDVSPLLEAAPLLYGVWIAERSSSLAAIVAAEPAGLDPVVAALIERGRTLPAVDAFAGMHRLAELRSRAAPIWDQVDALMLPTTPFHPTHDQVAADPFGVNERLGAFTNFANLLDLAALAVPAAARRDGLPFGVSLLAPAFADARLLELGAEWTVEHAPAAPLGVATGETVVLAVAGAHMRGLPLNRELTDRGARFVRSDRTAASYRLLSLPGGEIRRPGLIRSGAGGGSIEVELWQLTPAALGSLMLGIPAPLAIGRVQLAGGADVAGFVCEGHAAAESEDITAYGGWRAYLAAGGT
jgi:allophanate hydrolase